jgi:hypothetical protein
MKYTHFYGRSQIISRMAAIGARAQDFREMIDDDRRKRVAFSRVESRGGGGAKKGWRQWQAG